MNQNIFHRQFILYAAFGLPLIFLTLFFFYPLTIILLRSLAPVGSSSWPDLAYLLRLLGFTIAQAALSTLITLLLGLPAAHVMARYRFRGRSLLHALITIPFVMPTPVAALALFTLLGPNGVLSAGLTRWFHIPPFDLQHTLAIILIAHVFYNYSVVQRVVGSVWAHLDGRLEEAAQTLGAGRWRVWWEITLPQLTPAIAAAALLVFVFCFTSFGVIMILGGPRLATIEVEIYRQAAHLLNLPTAAVLSVLQLGCTLAAMGAYTALQRHTARPLDARPRQIVQQPPQSWRARLWIGLNVLIMIGLLLTPLGALVWRSLTRDGVPTLRYYVALTQNPGRSYFFIPPLTAIRNSLMFATLTVALSLPIGALGAYLLTHPAIRKRRLVAWLDPLLSLPLGASAVTLGLGYLIAFGRPPTNWLASPLMIPLAHTLIAFPFVLRSVLPALRNLRPALRQAAATLGAPPWRVWLAVDLPLLARPLLVGAAFAFAISLGEFGATLLLVRREYATIPVALYRYLSNPGDMNLGQALALSVILMLICAAALMLIEQFQIGEAGAF